MLTASPCSFDYISYPFLRHPIPEQLPHAAHEYPTRLLHSRRFPKTISVECRLKVSVEAHGDLPRVAVGAVILTSRDRVPGIVAPLDLSSVHLFPRKPFYCSCDCSMVEFQIDKSQFLGEPIYCVGNRQQCVDLCQFEVHVNAVYSRCFYF